MAYIFKPFLICIVVICACMRMFAAPAAAQTLSSIIFAGLEVETRSTFLHGGAKLSLDVGKQKIFILTASGLSLTDLRLARQGRIEHNEVNAKAQLFVGLERGFGSVFISAGLGPSLNRYVDRAGIARIRTGIAGLADVWYRPDSRQVLALATVVDSGARSIWTRIRYGWRTPLAGGYVGPEVAASRDATSRKWRMGLHFSEWKIGPITGAISAGFTRADGKSGAYASLSAYMSY